MTSRFLTALLALILSATPALGVLCGVDCGKAGAHRGHEDGSHAGEAHASQDPLMHAGEHSAPNAEAPPHDCHHAAPGGDSDVLRPGPQSCTHLRFESSPAKPTPASDALVLRDVSIHAILVAPRPDHRSDRLATAPASARSPDSPALVLPLRI